MADDQLPPDVGLTPPGSRGSPRADEDTVRALLRAQVPHLAHLPLAPGPSGWDNTHWLLGREHAVRLPRRRTAVPLVANEVDALTALLPALPLPVPIPLHVGAAGEGWPWPWTVIPWFAGDRSDTAHPPLEPRAHARALGRFLAALHHPAPARAPHNPYRSVPVADRVDGFERALAGAHRQGRGKAELVLRDAVARAVAAPPHAGPRRWIHGDLHPGNQLADGGELVAVIDWGDVAGGDPAADLATAWWTLPLHAHGDLRAAYGDIVQATWDRARGWAALIAAFLIDQGPRTGDPLIVAMAERTVARLTAEG